jgi:hypothetical protein
MPVGSVSLKKSGCSSSFAVYRLSGLVYIYRLSGLFYISICYILFGSQSVFHVTLCPTVSHCVPVCPPVSPRVPPCPPVSPDVPPCPRDAGTHVPACPSVSPQVPTRVGTHVPLCPPVSPRVPPFPLTPMYLCSICASLAVDISLGSFGSHLEHHSVSSLRVWRSP